jgi:hypothetical protein
MESWALGLFFGPVSCIETPALSKEKVSVPDEEEPSLVKATRTLLPWPALTLHSKVESEIQRVATTVVPVSLKPVE